MKKSVFVHVVIIFLLSAYAAYGGTNWPGWRGVDAMGVSDGSPPSKWSETENIKWKVKMPDKGDCTRRTTIGSSIGNSSVRAYPG